ncbi:MAG TPA: teichoic acid D-Ala incorporation-associated protein DltX [Kofleriaceae bacterium]|nr:teichoic acid D-Ala incorporation-associated protein DltX [Kofleriaceae bacterium]
MSPIWREVARIALRTVFYYLLLLAILLMWHSGGLFIYENF